MHEHADVILLAGYATPLVMHFGGFTAACRLAAAAADVTTTVVEGTVSVKIVV